MTAFLKELLRRLLNPGIYAAALVTAVLVVAAYQIRPGYDIQIGMQTDGTILQGFNAGEKMAQGGGTFRWTGADSYIVLQDVGRQDFDVTLTLSGSRPQGQSPPTLRVESGGAVLLDKVPAPDLVDYKLTVSRDVIRDGTLTLHILTNGFSPPGDSRTLGVVLTRLQAYPGAAADRFIEPPLGALGTLVGASALFALLLALLGWGVGGVLLGSSLVGTLAACLLVWNRLWFTSDVWYGTWIPTLLYAGIFTLLVWAVGSLVLHRRRNLPGGWSLVGIPFRILLTIMLATFAVRLAGQLHPQIFVVDLLYHVHRYQDVQNGTLIIMHVASELAGRDTFYLPTAYVFMMPLQWLVGDIVMSVRLFTIALSTLGAFLVYYLCAVGLRSIRAGLLAAVLYVSMPLSVLIFSWGVTTNVFADFISLLLFTLFVTARDLNPRKAAFWWLFVFLFVGVLSHPAVVVILSFAIGLLCLTWVFLGRSSPDLGWRRLGWTAAAYGVALALAYAVYYVNVIPTMIGTLADISSGTSSNDPGAKAVHLLVGGAVSDKSLGLFVRYVDNWTDWFWVGLLGIWAEFWAYFKVWPLLGAMLGFALISPIVPQRSASPPSPGGARRRLYLAGLAWALAALVFLIVGWRFNLYVRYSLFALPAVAIGTAFLLARVYERGKWGRTLALLVTLFFAFTALVLWQYRINYGLK
ncbi:MAG: hypothetical protein ABJA50_01535 [Chloroflexota bacterium]